MAEENVAIIFLTDTFTMKTGLNVWSFTRIKKSLTFKAGGKRGILV